MIVYIVTKQIATNVNNLLIQSSVRLASDTMSSLLQEETSLSQRRIHALRASATNLEFEHVGLTVRVQVLLACQFYQEYFIALI